jgi:hypothetical protein
MIDIKRYLVVGGLGTTKRQLSTLIDILATYGEVWFKEYDCNTTHLELYERLLHQLNSDKIRNWVVIAFSASCETVARIHHHSILQRWFVEPCNVFPDVGLCKQLSESIIKEVSMKPLPYSFRFSTPFIWSLVFNPLYAPVWFCLSKLRNILFTKKLINDVDRTLLSSSKRQVAKSILNNVLNRSPMWIYNDRKKTGKIHVITGTKSKYHSYHLLAAEVNLFVHLHKITGATHQVMGEHPMWLADIILNLS